jgi:hypothetical protein
LLAAVQIDDRQPAERALKTAIGGLVAGRAIGPPVDHGAQGSVQIDCRRPRRAGSKDS